MNDERLLLADAFAYNLTDWLLSARLAWHRQPDAQQSGRTRPCSSSQCAFSPSPFGTVSCGSSTGARYQVREVPICFHWLTKFSLVIERIVCFLSIYCVVVNYID